MSLALFRGKWLAITQNSNIHRVTFKKKGKMAANGLWVCGALLKKVQDITPPAPKQIRRLDLNWH